MVGFLDEETAQKIIKEQEDFTQTLCAVEAGLCKLSGDDCVNDDVLSVLKQVFSPVDRYQRSELRWQSRHFLAKLISKVLMKEYESNNSILTLTEVQKAITTLRADHH